MKKLINSPKNIVPEMLEGYMLAFGGSYYRPGNKNALVFREKAERVSVVTGAGSGCEPWPIGIVGEGLADGAAIGHVFAAPPATVVAEVCKEVYNEKGVLLITGNHAGDVLNFELAAELAMFDYGIRCSTVFVGDDLASAPKKSRSERRGVAGVGWIIQIAAAAAAAGLSLEECAEVAKNAADNMSTLAAVLSAGVNPSTGNTMGEIAENEVHFGMGFNGEPGFLVHKMGLADEIIKTIMGYLCDDLELSGGNEAALSINGLGSTTCMEQLIACRSAVMYLRERGISVLDVSVLERMRAQESGGVSISLLRLRDAFKPYCFSHGSSPLLSKRHFEPWGKAYDNRVEY